VVRHHYRDGWEWHDDLLPEAADRLERWRSSSGGGGGSEVLEAVRSCLDDDLDTPGAVAAIDEGAAADADVTDAAMLLGVSLASTG